MGFNIDKIPSDLKKIMIESHMLSEEKEDDAVVKLLKLSEPGKLQLEYELQKKAFEIVENGMRNEPQAYAAIPRPRAFRVLNVSGTLQNFMKDNEITLKEGRLELMLMDCVKGEDLDTIMMREYLLRHPASPFHDKPEMMEGWSFFELREEAAEIGGFRIDFEKGERNFNNQEWRDYTRFRTTRDADLYRLGFRIESRLIDSVLHASDQIYSQADIVWGDGNLRNVMLEGSYAPSERRGEPLRGKAWMIDFGSARDVEALKQPAKAKQDATKTIEKTNARFGTI